MNNKTNYNQLYQNFSPKIQYKTQPFSFYNQNNQSQSSNNKISYNPNLMSNQNYFPNPKNPIKWRSINKINLSHLKNSRDINILQSYLDNLICGQITEEDIQSIQESSIVKLIQILQTMSDILLNEQAELENEKLKLESDNVNLMKEFQKKDKKNLKYKEEINRLKKEKKRDIGVINSYLNVLNNLKRGTYYHKENYNISDIDINQKKRYDNLRANNINPPQEGGEFKCDLCKNKTFPNEFELTKHLEEVHGIKKNMPIYQAENQPQEQIQFIKPEVTVNIPDNFYGVNNMNNNQNQNNEDILNEFIKEKEQFLRTLNEEKLRMQENNQNARNSQPNNILDNDYLNKFENTLKETFDNFKLKQQQQNNNQNINQFIEIEDDEEEKRKLKEIQDLKEQLENERKKTEKKRIDYETESKKYESIYLEIIQMKKFSEDVPPPKNELKFSENTNMQVAKLEYLGKNQHEDKNKIFNSGKLESDHDETDEEKKKQNELVDMYQNNYEELLNTIQQQIGKKYPQKDDDVSSIHETHKIENNDLFKNDLNKLHHKKSKNKDLDKYYKKYTKRDERYMKSNDYNDYLTETVPEKYEPDDIKDLLEEKTEETAKGIFPKNLKLNFEIDEDLIKEESINDLYDLTNNLINDMDKKNPQNQFLNNYYQSMMEMIGFKNIQNNINEIKTKLNSKKNEENKKKEIAIDNNDKKGNDNNNNNNNNNNNILNSVVNSINKINDGDKKEVKKLNESIQIIDDIKENEIGENNKEIKGGLEITDFLMEPNDKKDDDIKLKALPNNKPEINNINNNKEKIPEKSDDNTINIQPTIMLKNEKTPQVIIIKNEDIKETTTELNKPQENNLQTQTQNIVADNNNININSNIINNENSMLPMIQIKTEEKIEEKKENQPKIEEKKEEKKEENQPKIEESISLMKDSNIVNNNNLNNNLNGNLNSNLNNNPNNSIEYNTINQNLQPNVKYTYYQGNITQQAIKNNSDTNKTNNNNEGYTSIMANNTNFDIGYNSVTGTKLINNNSNERKDKHLDQPYTSSSLNNMNNTQNFQGFSSQQGIYSQIKSDEKITDNQGSGSSNKIKESEMVLEVDENNGNKLNNNNNNQIIKDSEIINGNENEKSMEFDKYFGKK